MAMKIKLAKNQLLYYEESYQFMNPIGEAQLKDRGWGRYAILRKVWLDPLEPVKNEVKEIVIKRLEL